MNKERKKERKKGRRKERKKVLNVSAEVCLAWEKPFNVIAAGVPLTAGCVCVCVCAYVCMRNEDQGNQGILSPYLNPGQHKHWATTYLDGKSIPLLMVTHDLKR